jgi:quercetin dioxygenase-like cupin family protein
VRYVPAMKPPSVFKFGDLPRSHSTRDGRDRIDLVTKEMFGFDDLKADHITYHPGDTAAAHYHVGAKHFFFVDQGTGILHLDDRVYTLEQGDVAFCDEGEAHWFENRSEGLFSFYELWVPLPKETIWIVEDDQ